MKRFWLFCVLTAATVVLNAAPVRTITVTKQVEDNPRIYFGGIPGDPELSRAVNSFLRVCGWFDMGEKDKAAFELKLHRSGAQVVGDLSSGGAPVASWNFRNAADPRAT